MNDILVGRAAYEAELANALDRVAKLTARRRELESALETMIMPRESAGVSVSNEHDTREGQSQRDSLRATIRESLTNPSVDRGSCIPTKDSWRLGEFVCASLTILIDGLRRAGRVLGGDRARLPRVHRACARPPVTSRPLGPRREPHPGTEPMLLQPS